MAQIDKDRFIQVYDYITDRVLIGQTIWVPYLVNSKPIYYQEELVEQDTTHK